MYIYPLLSTKINLTLLRSTEGGTLSEWTECLNNGWPGLRPRAECTRARTRFVLPNGEQRRSGRVGERRTRSRETGPVSALT